ncbi:MAG: FAD-dependent monooxygenase [Pseudomonadota bacterium]
MNDVIIAGGGIVGLTLALCFKQDGFSPLVLEPKPPPKPPADPFAVRSYAIAAGSVALLEDLGVWASLDGARIAQFDAISVWVDRREQGIEFRPPSDWRGAMGFLVEHDHLHYALYRQAAAEGVEVRGDAVIDYEGATKTVVTDRGRIAGELVIGADGGQSKIRDCAGFNVKNRQLDQVVVAFNIATELPIKRTASQRFLVSGPLAFLPLPAAHQAAVVWTCSRSLAEWAMQASDVELGERLTDLSQQRYGKVDCISSRVSFSLGLIEAQNYCRGRCVLVGDAAHVIHPLAGQGLNLGLMDAAALAECVGPALGDASGGALERGLRRYNRWRKSEAFALIATTNGLNRGLSNDVRIGREFLSAGMALVNRTAAKRYFAARAMGIAGDLPQRVRERVRKFQLN